jgi:hypothetical protein
MSLEKIFAEVKLDERKQQKPAAFQADVTQEEALDIVEDLCRSNRRFANRLILTSGFGDWGRDSWVSALYSKIGKRLVIHSADDYFMRDGKYKFDSSNLKWAHQSCQGKVCNSLMNRKLVLVANANLYTDHINMYNQFKEDFIIVQFIPRSLKAAKEMGKGNSKSIPESAFAKGYFAMKEMDIHPEIVPRMSAWLRIHVGEPENVDDSDSENVDDPVPQDEVQEVS